MHGTSPSGAAPLGTSQSSSQFPSANTQATVTAFPPTSSTANVVHTGGGSPFQATAHRFAAHLARLFVTRGKSRWKGAVCQFHCVATADAPELWACVRPTDETVRLFSIRPPLYAVCVPHLSVCVCVCVWMN
mmetsp:Transcript_29615/g.49159  ORF Transcript_29615/g.49159 Transcript_29615/m.49159 type:complete len:132 (-) Transcript_29615:133-528(-)